MAEKKISLSSRTSSFGKDAIISQTKTDENVVADKVLNNDKPVHAVNKPSSLAEILGSRPARTAAVATPLTADSKSGKPSAQAAAQAIGKTQIAQPGLQYAVSGFNIISADQREVTADPNKLKNEMDALRPFFERLQISPIEITIDQAGMMIAGGLSVPNLADPAAGFILSLNTSSSKQIIGYAIVAQTFNTMHVPGSLHITTGDVGNHTVDYAVDLTLPTVNAIGKAGFLAVQSIEKEVIAGTIGTAFTPGAAANPVDSQSTIDGDCVLTLAKQKGFLGISGNNVRAWVYPVTFTKEIAAAISAQISTGSFGSLAKLLVDYLA